MKSTRRSGALMLVELLLALMFFAVCAAICLRLFVTARQMGEQSVAMDNAVIQAQNAAEAWKSSGGDITKTLALLGGEYDPMRSVAFEVIAFDEHWEITDSEDYAYYMLLIPMANELSVTIQDHDGTEIFSISTAVPVKGVAA